MLKFDKIYADIVEKQRGNLTSKEYRKLIVLEYVITWQYTKTYAKDRKEYLQLMRKKYNLERSIS